MEEHIEENSLDLALVDQDDKRVIDEDSLPMELNIIDQPFFLHGYRRVTKNPSIKEITASEYNKYLDVLDNPKKIFERERIEALGIEYIQKDGIYYKTNVNEETLFEYSDSKNNDVMFKISSAGYIPREFEFFVFVALIKLFIKYNSPIKFDNKKNKYVFRKKRLYFSFYELAKIMNTTRGGKTYREMRKSIITMANTKYISNGIFYQKESESYLTETSEIVLIQEFKFSSILDNEGMEISDKSSGKKTRGRNYIVFSDKILSNIEFQYFKYIDIDIFFNKLKTGLERKLYMYIERNKRDKNRKKHVYIERKYSTLGYKIPVIFDKDYEFKAKTSRAFEKLKEVGIIKDCIFCHSTPINGKKASKIIICLEYDAETTKNLIENEIVDNEEVATTVLNQLEIPKNIPMELQQIGVTDNMITALMKEYDKWKLITYIMYFKRVRSKQKKKIDNGGGLFVDSIKYDFIDSQPKSKVKDILDMVEAEKIKESKTESDKLIKIEESYNKFIDEKIEIFKKEYSFEYQIEYNKTLAQLRKNIKNKKENLKQSLLILEDDKCENIKNELELINKFTQEQEKSEYFKKAFRSELIVYLMTATDKKIKTMDKETFKYNYLKKLEEK